MKNNFFIRKKLKEFGILICFCFPLFIGWLIPFLTGHTFKFWTLLIGLVSLILSIVNPYLLYYPYKLWMALGNILSWLNSRLILGMVFFAILLPIALIMKMFGYDPLRKKQQNNNKTYREENKDNKIDLTKIF
tara:strand:- start:372 stop:770 length:399 start_codon:yes stop_codon:yes gene_type:complete